MAKNKDGIEKGSRVEADDLLTHIAKARQKAKEPAKKAKKATKKA